MRSTDMLSVSLLERTELQMNTLPQINLPPLLCEERAARFLSISKRTLQAWRVAGTGPLFIRMGRAIRYCQTDLVEWMNSKRCSR
jgi:hypothetical protein